MPGGGDGERQHDARKGEEHIGKAHDDRIHLAADIAGNDADGRADAGDEDDDRQRHEHRYARAVNHARKEIAPEFIRSEPMLGGRRQKCLLHRRLIGILRQDEGREKRCEEDQPCQYGIEAQELCVLAHGLSPFFRRGSRYT